MKLINLYANDDTLLNILQLKKELEKELLKNDEHVKSISTTDLFNYINIGDTTYCKGSLIIPFKLLEINNEEYFIYIYTGNDEDSFINNIIKIAKDINNNKEYKQMDYKEALKFNFDDAYLIINNKQYYI